MTNIAIAPEEQSFLGVEELKPMLTSDAQLISLQLDIAQALAQKTYELDPGPARSARVPLLQSWIPLLPPDPEHPDNPPKHACKVTVSAIKAIAPHFDQFYMDLHRPYANKRFMRQFTGHEDEHLFDHALDWFFSKIYSVTCKKECLREFKHFMVNRKRNMLGLPVHDDTMLYLYSPAKGIMKSTLMESFCKALSGHHDDLSFAADVIRSPTDIFSFESKAVDTARTVLFCDDCSISRNEWSKEDSGMLKSWIMQPTFVRRIKHSEPRPYVNYLGLVMTSQFNLLPVLFPGEATCERRLCPIEALGAYYLEKNGRCTDWVRFFQWLWALCPTDPKEPYLIPNQRGSDGFKHTAGDYQRGWLRMLWEHDQAGDDGPLYAYDVTAGGGVQAVECKFSTGFDEDDVGFLSKRGKNKKWWTETVLTPLTKGASKEALAQMTHEFTDLLFSGQYVEKGRIANGNQTVYRLRADRVADLVNLMKEDERAVFSEPLPKPTLKLDFEEMRSDVYSTMPPRTPDNDHTKTNTITIETSESSESSESSEAKEYNHGTASGNEGEVEGGEVQDPVQGPGSLYRHVAHGAEQLQPDAAAEGLPHVEGVVARGGLQQDAVAEVADPAGDEADRLPGAAEPAGGLHVHVGPGASDGGQPVVRGEDRAGTRVSVCCQRGKFCKQFHSVDLGDFLAGIDRYAGADKHSCFLVHAAYNPEKELYSRKEADLSRIGCIILDCDNKTPQLDENGNEVKDAEGKTVYVCKDPKALDKFKDSIRLGNRTCYVWESASSKPDFPKWRALIPLTGEIDFDVATKKAMLELFSGLADDCASWYYTPTNDKLGTIWINNGTPYPAEIVEQRAAEIRKAAEAQKIIHESRRAQRVSFAQMFGLPTGDWHRLPAVKEYFTNCGPGHWDDPCHKALYSVGHNYDAAAVEAFLEEAHDKGLPEEHYSRFARDIAAGKYNG